MAAMVTPLLAPSHIWWEVRWWMGASEKIRAAPSEARLARDTDPASVAALALVPSAAAGPYDCRALLTDDSSGAARFSALRLPTRTACVTTGVGAALTEPRKASY